MLTIRYCTSRLLQGYLEEVLEHLKVAGRFDLMSFKTSEKPQKVASGTNKAAQLCRVDELTEDSCTRCLQGLCLTNALNCVVLPSFSLLLPYK
jgi:hypothetical protein